MTSGPGLLRAGDSKSKDSKGKRNNLKTISDI
jgi:hypothetical protein